MLYTINDIKKGRVNTEKDRIWIFQVRITYDFQPIHAAEISH